MRKGFLVGLAIFLFSPVFSQNVPESLCGIWEGKDRFVFFEQIPADRNPQLCLLMKEYYGWYIDRTAESEEYEEKEKRARNAGTAREAQKIDIMFEEMNEWEGEQKAEGDFWAGYINLVYSKSQSNKIPVCVLDGKMYLDFYVQDKENPQFYRGNAVSKGIQIAQQKVPENITGFVIDNNKIFNIRYWKTDMDFSEDNATFKYEDKTYTVPRHIKAGNTIYSCVSGRSKKVRNIVPPQEFNKEKYLWNKDSSVMIADSDFYLFHLKEHKTFEDLMSIVSEQNNSIKNFR